MLRADETETKLLPSQLYHMELDRRRIIRAESFVKRSGRSVLSSIDFHMVMVIVTENNLGSCRPKTANTVPMAEKVQTEYGGARIFDGDDINFGCTVGGRHKEGHVNSKPYHMESFLRQSSWPEVFAPIDLYIVMLTVPDKYLASYLTSTATVVAV